ncbi:hypothetical protein BYT27DRAFT_7018997, partial [Phlegmacium glaucopus]
SKDHAYLLSSSLGPSASIKPKSYNLIFKFVPCTGDFDPENANLLTDIESNNNLPPSSILSASWIKRSDCRSPNQKVASLKIACASPESANHLLCEKVFIEGQAITVRKDLKEPIRCNKCQEHGHIRANCHGTEVCAHCASNGHTTINCPPNQPARCRSCGPGSTHPSYSRSCPVFNSKCVAIDARYPKNSMPYFPTGERWTWATAPPKLSTIPP